MEVLRVPPTPAPHLVQITMTRNEALALLDVAYYASDIASYVATLKMGSGWLGGGRDASRDVLSNLCKQRLTVQLNP